MRMIRRCDERDFEAIVAELYVEATLGGEQA
jgi:hypothetical protein